MILQSSLKGELEAIQQQLENYKVKTICMFSLLEFLRTTGIEFT